MQIQLLKADQSQQQIIQNLGRFYVYDMSRYCGFLPGWQTPENGLFECNDLTRYWTEENRFPFLVHVDDEIAGFVLVNKIGSTADVDWNMAEFFIVAKFQKHGVGSEVAMQMFSQFSGIWEVMQIPENSAAICFWEKIIARYTDNQYTKAKKVIEEPQPHPTIVIRFQTK